MEHRFPILVAEDDFVIRKLLEKVLTQAGHEVTLVENGRKALELFNKHYFPIVLTDWMMPEMDGLELCRAIRNSDVSGYVFIVLLTAKDSKDDIVAGLKAGADDYLIKPFNRAELVARLNTGLRILELERSLKTAKKYTENIISSMGDSLVVINPDMRINLVNRATCEMLGYSENELMGKSIDEVFPEGISFRDMLLKDLLQKGFVKDYEMSYKTKTGEKIPVSFKGSVMYEEDSEKKPAGIICVAHDLRELRQLQEQVFQSEKMASIGVLAAGVAHEIKNPLAIILQGIEFLRFSFSTKYSQEALLIDSAERIKHAALRADKIVKDLLAFSSRSSITFETVSVSSIIEETISLVEHQFSLKKIDIIRQFSDDLPAIKANSNQIKQVFINILVNAVEAMPDGGTITIDSALEETGPQGKYLRIAFTDTGYGISEYEIARVFEPFFSTKDEAASAGLGLSVSQGIIEKHKGTIGIESEIGKGTKISIFLPY